MLSPRVIAYYGLIRTSQPLPSIYVLLRWVFALRPCMGWYRETPNLPRVSFLPVPPSVPRRTEWLHMIVTSPFTVAFAIFAQARHPQLHKDSWLVTNQNAKQTHTEERSEWARENLASHRGLSALQPVCCGSSHRQAQAGAKPRRTAGWGFHESTSNS